MINSKKAQEGLTLTQVIGIVMAVIAIIALTLLIVRLSKPFFGKQGYDATKNNFDELTGKVQEMLDNKQDLVVERFFPYFIDKKYSVFGFEKNKDFITLKTGTKVFKPTFCTDKACLCLYITAHKFSEDTKDNNVLFCRSFEGDVIFYGKNRNKKPTNYGGEISLPSELKEPGQTYGYLAIYQFGQSQYPILEPNIWNVQNLYIEKRKEGDKIYLYITIEDT